MSDPLRTLAREMFADAMAATTVAAAVERLVLVENGMLSVGPHQYDLALFSRVLVISIGKAGSTLFDALRTLLPAATNLQAVISAPVRPRQMSESDCWHSGGHPLPDEASLLAAKDALHLLEQADEQTLVLFLISGGASSMFEAPLHPGMALEDLREFNRLLVGSGASIREVNCVRKHFSAVKGGRLAVRSGAATKLTLLVSDVPEDALDALGSGPTLPDLTTSAMVRSIVDTHLGGAASLPPGYAEALHDGLEETPKPEDAAFNNASAVVLLDNAQLLQSAKAAAEQRGYNVIVDNTCDDWDYAAAADYLLHRFHALALKHQKLCLLSGGEVTVRLPLVAGQGGRNQQWALYCAMKLADGGRSACILSAGSDGIDGNSPAAGCVADQSSCKRGMQAGLDPARHLAAFDAFPFFSGIGDAIISGPSGNNLRDIRMLLSM